MTTQIVKCPTCKTTSTVSGQPGEKILLTCPQCNQKGAFTIPEEKSGKMIDANTATIEVSGLTKSYNNFTAVNNVSFTVTKGEIFGFLGPNGAGKTTTIKSMLDLIHANTGNVKINGIDVRAHGKEAKKYVGYMPEKVAFYDNMHQKRNAPISSKNLVLATLVKKESGSSPKEWSNDSEWHAQSLVIPQS
jgi:ABC-type glutathione transport system ATPase component